MVTYAIRPQEKNGETSLQQNCLVYMHGICMYSMYKRKTEKPAQALRAVNLARNTLRDFLGMVELKIIDERKYDETIARVRQQREKSSVKEKERRKKRKGLSSRVN